MQEKIKECSKLIKLITKNKNHYEDFEKNSETFQQDRLRILKEIDLIYKKQLREEKNEFNLLKKQFLVMGFKIEDIQDFQDKEKQKLQIEQKKKKLQKKIAKQKLFLQSLKKKANLEKTSISNQAPQFTNKQRIIFQLDEKLMGDPVSQNLFKVIKMLQAQVEDSEEQLNNLQASIEIHRKKINGQNENVNLNEKQSLYNSLEQKNFNVQSIIEKLEKENENLLKDFQVLQKQFLEKQENLNLIIDANKNNGQNNLENQTKEIQVLNKKIINLETQILNLSENKKNRNILYQPEDIQKIEEQIIQQKQENQMIQQKVDTQSQKSKQLKEQIQNLNLKLQILKEEYIRKQAFFNHNIFDFAQLDQTQEIEESKNSQQKLIQNEINKKRIYLADFGDQLNKFELKNLGLEKDSLKKGWYILNTSVNKQHNNLLQLKDKILNEENQCIQLSNKIQQLKKQQNQDSFFPKQNMAICQELERYDFQIKQFSEIVQDQKEAIQYKIENQLVQPQQNKLNQSIFSEDENSEENTGQNYMQVYLGNFKVFGQLLKIPNKNAKVLCFFQFLDFEICYSKIIETLEGDFQSEFDFPLNFDLNLINSFQNFIFKINIQVQSQDFTEILNCEISLSDFFNRNKNLKESPFMYQNKEIIFNDKNEHIGFLELFMKFKYSPALNILLLETGLNDLKSIKTLIKQNENIKKFIKTQITEEQENFQSEIKENFLRISLKEIICEKMDLKVFLYYESYDQQYISADINLNKGSKLLQDTQQIPINIEKQEKILFYLFNDSNDLQEGEDYIDKQELDLDLLKINSQDEFDLNFNYNLNFIISIKVQINLIQLIYCIQS